MLLEIHLRYQPYPHHASQEEMHPGPAQHPSQPDRPSCLSSDPFQENHWLLPLRQVWGILGGR